MINIRTIKKLKDDEGLTLKKGKVTTYKTGYQVAIYGIETLDPQIAIDTVRLYEGNCGLWYSNGIYYIDKSHRIGTKKDAIALGLKCNQISILKWADMSLIYLQQNS